ncbi:MAG: DUF853 family protein [Candidatus Diapherotrites archaeon]|nr:DUF853 family protein [Candidatus Diapherotrites archaeon]
MEKESGDVFEDVFGLDEEEKKAKERVLKLKQEKSSKKPAKVPNEEADKVQEPEERQEEPVEEEKSDSVEEYKEAEPYKEVEEPDSKEEKPKKRKRKAKEVEQPKEEKSELKEKIKRVIVAKAEKAAEKEEKTVLDKEIGIKESGTKDVSVKPDAKVEQKEEIPVSKIKPSLGFLKNDIDDVFIGRKKSVYQKYGNDAGLFIGNVSEEEMRGKKVYLDGLNPHVVFVCGARGSGKSYLLGVLAEELAIKNPNVGIIVIDPIGVFWGMRHPNKDERELELLAKTGLMPQGLDNLKVFIPKGVKDQVPKSTFDGCFSVPPVLLNTEDWCLTFGIDRFSPTGLLLEKTLEKVKKGYKTKEGKFVKPRENYSLEDVINCLHSDADISSQELGYKPDSVRALASRFDAAQAWGIFDKHGTPLIEISRENQLTIIDTSFLDDNVSALIIGLLSRRILAARKISTRREAASKLKEESVEQVLEFGIPPTWLFIDEAHTLIPSGNLKTPASNALIEYVKQGRQPGCSLVFATQQPSAIDTRVLSQLDIIVSHKLVFDDDVKAVYKRTPTIIPKPYKSSGFIKTLPVGVGLVGDRREETTRAFVMKIRPRMSQHEGRDAVTSERSSQAFDKDKVKALAVGMAFSKIEQEPIEARLVSQVVQTLNTRYKSDLQLSEVLDVLEEKGVIIDPKDSKLSLPNEEAEQEIAEELVEEAEKEVDKETKEVLKSEAVSLTAFPVNLDSASAKKVFDKMRKRKMLRLFGKEEAVEKISLKYIPIFHVRFNVLKNKNTFNVAEAYINSYTGEFLHFDFKRNQFIQSRGLDELSDLSIPEARLLLLLENRKHSFEQLLSKFGQDKAKLEKTIESLLGQELVAVEEDKERKFFFSRNTIDLPKQPLHSLLTSLNRLPVSETRVVNVEKPRFDKSKLQGLFVKLWGKIQLKTISEVFLPVYEAVVNKEGESVRVLMVDAYSGKQLRAQD